MSKEILMLVDALSNVKGLPREVVFEATEAALAAAAKKSCRIDMNADVRVNIDRATGNYTVTRYWTVVANDQDENFNPETQIVLAEAQQNHQSQAQVGEEITQSLEVEFGRIDSQLARNVALRKLREAEAAKAEEFFRPRIGELMAGVVRKVNRQFVAVDLGNNVEGLFLRDEMLPREAIRAGDRLRGYLYDVRTDGRNVQLMLSRTRPQMLVELFKLEVPEIAEQLIEIKSAARDPGVRAKIAVKTNDGRIDPIGACVGMRGARVQAVSGELGGERIDIVLWDDNPAQLVINAMAPAEVSSIVVDEDSHTIDIAVEEDQLSQAIGKNGQNVRLASQLTGWTINVMTKAQAEEKHKAESQTSVAMFTDELEVDEDLAKVLVDQGFTSVEEIAYVPVQELLAIEGFDEELVEALRSRAKDVLLTKAIATEERLGDNKPAQDLLALPGMDEALAYELAGHGIVTREDLAEQAVADLLDITSLDPGKAAELIMAARAPWFSAEKE